MEKIGDTDAVPEFGRLEIRKCYGILVNRILVIALGVDNFWNLKERKIDEFYFEQDSNINCWKIESTKTPRST